MLTYIVKCFDFKFNNLGFYLLFVLRTAFEASFQALQESIPDIEHMSGCLCGYCGTRSLLKVEELSNQKATSYKLKERVPNCSLGP